MEQEESNLEVEEPIEGEVPGDLNVLSGQDLLNAMASEIRGEEPTEEPVEEPQEEEPQPEVEVEEEPVEEPTESAEEPANAVLSEAQAKEALALLAWRNGLSDEQIELIDGVINGQLTVNPTGAPVAQAQPEEEYLDERAAKDIAALQQEIESLKAQTQQAQSLTLEQQRTQLQAVLDQSREAFRESHELTTEEATDLENKLVAANILPGISAQVRTELGGDNPSAAYQRGLEMIYRYDTKYQERELERALVKERQEQAQTKEKKLKAASLSNKGGSVSREPSTSSTPQDTLSLMADALKGAISGAPE